MRKGLRPFRIHFSDALPERRRREPGLQSLPRARRGAAADPRQRGIPAQRAGPGRGKMDRHLPRTGPSLKL